MSAHTLSAPNVRVAAWFAAALLVCALIAAALLAQFSVRETAYPPDRGVEAYVAPRAAPSSFAIAPANAPARGGAIAAPEQGPQAPPSALTGLANVARGSSFSAYRGERAIAPAPVEGGLSRDDALGRAIVRGLNARVENYARGEAQRYADPRDDPIYERGTDPADAAMRPCPIGQEPRGDGRNLHGRTCVPTR